nr:protein ANTAGONIST OF LIKE HETEROCHROMATIN PROTEIN 1-like [Hydra vulgaris]
MSPSTFEKLLQIVAHDITKNNTKMRKPICAHERHAITVRYLATGDAHTTIAANYRMSPTTVGRIVYETCNAIWNNLLREYVKTPNSETEWEKIAYEFETRWHFPHCVGAIDGKHVQMFAPARSGSSYFNYKKTHSIVLMAVSDAKYRFILVDIGDSGRQSNGSVYNNSRLGFAIENNLLKIPKDSKISNNSYKILPYVFVADDTFGLKRHMMKPYAFKNLLTDKLIFNYRLSRARRVVENAFGIASSRFRVFHKPIIAIVENVIAKTKADGPNGIQLGDWRKEVPSVNGFVVINNTSNNYSDTAKKVRDSFKEFFNQEGAVDWQLDIVKRVK